MRTSRKLTTTLQVPDHVELYDHRRDNLVRIENHDGGVVIRTARGDLADSAKTAFLHHLITEGFVAERYRWSPEESDRAFGGAKWITDKSWVGFKHRCIRAASRVWAYLSWGRLTALGLFLVALVTAIWLRPH